METYPIYWPQFYTATILRSSLYDPYKSTSNDYAASVANGRKTCPRFRKKRICSLVELTVQNFFRSESPIQKLLRRCLCTNYFNFLLFVRLHESLPPQISFYYIIEWIITHMLVEKSHTWKWEECSFGQLLLITGNIY